jgi:hypothetical protein
MQQSRAHCTVKVTVPELVAWCVVGVVEELPPPHPETAAERTADASTSNSNTCGCGLFRKRVSGSRNKQGIIHPRDGPGSVSLKTVVIWYVPAGVFDVVLTVKLPGVAV